ncbi:hypothetical protein [Brevundimonas sp.]|uniref:hypothetical protein n=1 Tax=Brevundimonas sp. TaxID=1871086 RepID=UPI0037BF8415
MTDWAAAAVPAEDLTPRIVVADGRMRLDLTTADPAVGLDFPWWDRMSDLAAFADWLGRDDAPDFSDADQGWIFDAARRDDRLCFRQGDLDTGEIFATLSVDRAVFLQRFQTALATAPA